MTARAPAKRLGRWACLSVAAVLAPACATTQPPKAASALPPPPATAPPSVKLAWLPLETRISPDLASAVNTRLGHVELEGVTRSFQAPVSMEMAQLAIECIERTPACYGAVGRSVGADRLLWADLEPGAKGSGRTVMLRVSLFDVGGQVMLQAVSRPFASTEAAREGVAGIMDGAFPARGVPPGAKP
jgi:hypothetical protein